MNIKLKSEDIPLHVAAANGDFTTLKRLLAEGADPAVRDRAGNTALHHCPFCRPCIKLLVEYGLDVNLRNKYKQTPLHVFISSVLLEFGADINLQDCEGRTPLHINVHRNWAGVAQLLIALGADLELRDKWGRTPLHQAAIARSSESLLMLIAYGANLDTRDNQGRTPLESIEAGEYEGIVADCDAMDPFYIIRMLQQASSKGDVRDEYEDTALISAARQDVVEAMPFLLQQGADLWAVSDNGWSRCQYAESARSLDAIRHCHRLSARSYRGIITGTWSRDST